MQATLGQPELLLAKYVSHRNAISMTSQIFGMCTLATHTSGGNSKTVIYFYSCTMHGYWRMCQMQKVVGTPLFKTLPWFSGFNYRSAKRVV
jgi:hypothetical protein